MIKRRHQGSAPLGRKRLGDGLAIFRVAVVEHDCGAQGARVAELYRRRIPGHDDGCPRAQPARRLGHPLGMIAR